jgi:hypothetical protein
MKSPFPGMDPYLEGREWLSVHTELSTEIARQLAARLRPRYTVRTTRRFFDEVLRHSITVEVGSKIAPQPLQQTTALAGRVPHVTIEVRDVRTRSLVTIIDLLTLANKRGNGRRDYLARRERILQSAVHLVEIDLLRKGERLPVEADLPDTPYMVVLSRAERRPTVELWPIALEEPLPTIPIPLQVGEPDAVLDVQAALDTVYHSLNYDLSVDYTRLPDVPLEGDAAAWVAEVLRSRRG